MAILQNAVGPAGYLELNQNSTQSISANTITAVQFPNSIKNNFGANLTVSGTGNTTFTNAAGTDMYLIISAAVNEDSASANPGHAAWLYIKTSRSIGNTTTISQFANDGNFGTTGALSISQPLFLANGDSFQIAFISNIAMSLGNSASIQSTGQILRTSLIVIQV